MARDFTILLQEYIPSLLFLMLYRRITGHYAESPRQYRAARLSHDESDCHVCSNCSAFSTNEVFLRLRGLPEYSRCNSGVVPP